MEDIYNLNSGARFSNYRRRNKTPGGFASGDNKCTHPCRSLALRIRLASPQTSLGKFAPSKSSSSLYNFLIELKH